MEKLDAILFDLDGTIVDSAPDLRQGLNVLLQEEGRAPLSLEQVKTFIGDGAMALVQRAFAATGESIQGDPFPYVQRYIRNLRTVKPDPAQIFPYVRETLEKLKEAGVKIGMCTNKNEALTTKLLEDLDLIRYFGFVAGADTFQVHKPHPGHILGTVEALEADPARTLFVGDGPNDVVASTRANMKCIVVTHGYSRDYEEMGADKLVDRFDDLPRAIEALGFRI